MSCTPARCEPRAPSFSLAPSVRLVRRAEVACAAETLAQAFLYDPLYLHVLSGAAPARLRALLEAIVELALAYGHVYCPDTPRNGVAVLLPPSVFAMPLSRIVPMILRKAHRTGLSAITRLMDVALVAWLGWGALFYLFLSFWFSTGLHPLGVRAVQEHTQPGGSQHQQTYSYYGRLNRIYFNYGHHAEHHDLMMIPGPRLSQVRKLAPEFYDTQHSYRSLTKLLVQFVSEPRFDLFGRGVRREGALAAAVHPEHAAQD